MPVGHVLTMAKDKWGSLVLAGALSHVDDTVLLGKVVLPPIKVSAFDFFFQALQNFPSHSFQIRKREMLQC